MNEVSAAPSCCRRRRRIQPRPASKATRPAAPGTTHGLLLSDSKKLGSGAGGGGAIFLRGADAGAVTAGGATEAATSGTDAAMEGADAVTAGTEAGSGATTAAGGGATGA